MTSLPDEKQRGQSRLSTQALVVILGRSLAKAAHFLSGAILVRFLVPADYGTFLQANTMAESAGMLLGFRLPKSLYYFVPQLKRETQRRFITRNLLFVLLLALIPAALLILLREEVGALFNNLQLGTVMPLVVLILIGRRFQELLPPILITTGRAKLSGILAPIKSVTTVLGTCIPPVMGYGLSGALWGLGLSLLFWALFTVAYVRYLPAPAARAPHPFTVGSEMRYVLPLAFSVFVSLSGNYIDNFIVAVVNQPAEYAVYARGAFELPLVALLPYTLADLIMPRLVTYYKQGRFRRLLGLWHESIRRTAMVIVPAFAFFFVAADTFILFMFTETYRGSVLIFRIYLFTLPFRLTAYGTILLAAGKSKEVFKAGLVFTLANIASNAVLYFPLGSPGLALSRVIATAVQVGYFLFKIKSLLGISAGELMPWKPLAKTAAVAAVAGLAIWPLSWLSLARFWILCLQGSAFLLVCLCLMVVFQVINREDRELIGRFMPLRSS